MRSVLNFVAVSLVIVLFASCKKDSGEINDDLSVALPGKWELRQSSRSMDPTIQNYLPGNGNLIQFTETNYELYQNGLLTKSGTYVIVPDTTVFENVCLIFPQGKFTKRLIYDNDEKADKIFVDVTDNRLTFVSGCYGYDAGRSSEYEKIP